MGLQASSRRCPRNSAHGGELRMAAGLPEWLKLDNVSACRTQYRW